MRGAHDALRKPSRPRPCGGRRHNSPSSMLCVKLPLFCRPPRRCSASAQVAEARRRAPGSCPSPRCGPGPPRRVFAASSAAAPDRSALCDFFDSQRGLAPPRPSLRRARAAGGLRGLGGRLLTGPRFLGTPDTRHEAAAVPSGRHGFSPRGRTRGADAAQEGSGALGERVLAGYYFLGTPDTRRHGVPRRRRAGDLELRVPGEEAPARTDDVLGRPKTSRVGVGLARTRRKAAKPGRRIPKRGASEAEKDDEKGTSHAQNGVAETGRGPANATSREPA